MIELPGSHGILSPSTQGSTKSICPGSCLHTSYGIRRVGRRKPRSIMLLILTIVQKPNPLTAVLHRIKACLFMRYKTLGQDPDWYGGYSSCQQRRSKHQHRNSAGLGFIAAGPMWSFDMTSRVPRIHRRRHGPGMDYVMSGGLQGTDHAGMHRHNGRPLWRQFGW